VSDTQANTYPTPAKVGLGRARAMKALRWPLWRQLKDLLDETSPPPEQMALRLKTVERDVILPVKAVFILILFYNLYLSRWFDDVTLPQSVAQQLIEQFFIIYLLVNLIVAGILIFGRKFPGSMIQRLIFTASFLDGLFVAALAYVTGGFASIVYWLFLGLIARNALSCPLAVPQLILNLSVSFCYLGAGILDIAIRDSTWDYTESSLTAENTPEPFVLRLIVLWMTTVCCYGVQVLLEKQRRASEEAREYAVRQEQLRSAGHLAAKIAHQIKNPLGIINNAAYSIQRALQEGKAVNPQQIEIIREEIGRADNTITKLMGYAQLAEGKVEKLAVTEELDRAIDLAVPPAAKYPVTVIRDYAPGLPVLMMQRGHLSEVLVNLIQNAREAMVGRGTIKVSARPGENQTVVITVSDDGPGISRTRLDKIFQAYFTTKEKGTGLGLAIVKHNTELYNGTVHVESELGKGTKFTLIFPTRTIRTPSPSQ
jgi:signal transduction histidine kinase